MPGSMTNTFGWSMNWQRKQMAISFVIDLFGQKMLRIHDEVTYDSDGQLCIAHYGELGPASEKGTDDAVTSLAIAVGTIQLDLAQSHDPREALQSYSLELAGNVFEPPSPAPTMQSGDIGGMTWWEAMEDPF